jgi:hypothetical protein
MSQQLPHHPVRVIDVDMPFTSMVVFMVKWALASIPAFIILFGLLFALTIGAIVLVGGVGAGLMGSSTVASPDAVTTPSPTPKNK